MEIKIVVDIESGKAQLEIKGARGLSFVPLYGDDHKKLIQEQQIVNSEIVTVSKGCVVRIYKLH